MCWWRIADGDNFTNADILLGNYIISKAPGAPAARPVLAAAAESSFTLADQGTAITGQSIEYGISIINSVPSVWQDSPVFTDIHIDTVYFVFARSKSNANYESGSSSQSRQVEIDGTIWVSVLERDRIIPVSENFPPVAGGTVFSLTDKFTAGPNPVSKSSGTVNFFVGAPLAGTRDDGSPAHIHGTLTIYDASGSIINKIKIIGNANNNSSTGALHGFSATQARRPVGSWDLKDAKGRPVSEGTYLVRGTIKTADGKSEKVSLLLGVR